MKNSRYIPIVAATALSLLLAACSSEEQGPAGPETGSFDAVVQQAEGGYTEASNVVEDTTAVDTTISEVVGGEDFFCRSYTVRAEEAPADFPLFDPNVDVIYPGNLLQGASLEFATPDPIPVDRGPGTIVMVIDNGADSVTRTIPSVTLGNVFNAKNGIIQDNPGILPARFSFSREEIHSKEHMALALDVSFQNLTTDVSSQLTFSSDQEYNRYLVKLDQSFYTIAYQLPTSLEEVFASSVTPDQLSRYIGPGNPATFISSVTYGRKFYLLIESTASATEMGASLEATFNGAIAGGSLEAGATYVSELDNVRIKAFALGGEQGAALSAVTSDFDSLKTFLSQGGDIRTGLPLSYVVRSLANPSKIVSVKLGTEYDVVRCVPMGESVENPILWYRADEASVSGSSKMVTSWTNYFGTAGFDAQPPTKAYGGRRIDNAVSGPNLPAIKCQPGELTSNNEGFFGFSGINFRQTDFTVWLVGRLQSQFASYPEMVLWGSGTAPGSGLNIGFRNANQLVVSNVADTVNVPLQKSVDQYQLYTIRFSQAEGLQVFVNGSLDPVANDPGFTGSLSAFLDARLGSKNGNPLYIAEFKAYGTAVSKLQRESLDNTLLVKYGL